MPYLNGKLVVDDEIDSAKHKFIGTFRPVGIMSMGINAYVLCPCNSTLKTRNELMEHYASGHFDIPQYIDI